MSEHRDDGRPKPFTPMLIDSWARLMDVRLSPREAEALVELGHVWRHPPELDEIMKPGEGGGHG